MTDIDSLLIKVTKKYYILGLTQDEIAKEEGISKSSVSRILKNAEKKGYVRHVIEIPVSSVIELENIIKNKFDMKHVHVVPVSFDSNEIIMNDIATTVTNYLNSIVKSGDILGVSWGKTMLQISEYVRLSKKVTLKNIKVIQLNGGVSKSNIPTRGEKIVENFSSHFNGTGYLLPLPSFVDTPVLADLIIKDSMISKNIQLIKQANIAIFGIGYIDDSSILVDSGYFSKETFSKLKKEGFVGDICSRYFKADGSHPDQFLYNRVIGVTLEDLKEKEYSIGIAAGTQKLLSIFGALSGRYINTLFIDEITAKKLVELIP